jgi:hypothetical protein
LPCLRCLLPVSNLASIGVAAASHGDVCETEIVRSKLSLVIRTFLGIHRGSRDTSRELYLTHHHRILALQRNPLSRHSQICHPLKCITKHRLRFSAHRHTRQRGGYLPLLRMIGNPRTYHLHSLRFRPPLRQFIPAACLGQHNKIPLGDIQGIRNQHHLRLLPYVSPRPFFLPHDLHGSCDGLDQAVYPT